MDSKPIASTSPVTGRGATRSRGGPAPAPCHGKGDSGSARHEDLFRFAPGRMAVLRLLRERVLARTRCLLDLPQCVLPAHFAESSDIPVADFVGRLWAEQTQMAAPRLQVRSRGQVRHAMAEAFRCGARETLELLHDAGCVDGAGAELVAQALAAFARRLGEPDEPGGATG